MLISEIYASQLINFQLNNIGKARNMISEEATAQFHYLISSRIYYCNSLLYGMFNRSNSRLQKIQNTAARIFT